MSLRGALSRRLGKLEAQQVEENVVAMFAEVPDGRCWLSLRDGRQFEGEEALAMLDRVTWPAEGFRRLTGIDLDVVMGLKPEMSDEELERLQEQTRTMVSVLDRLGIRKS